MHMLMQSNAIDLMYLSKREVLPLRFLTPCLRAEHGFPHFLNIALESAGATVKQVMVTD